MIPKCTSDYSARRVDGLVVYLNGVELARDNLKPGPVFASNASSTGVSTGDEVKYFPCNNCLRNNSALLKVSQSSR